MNRDRSSGDVRLSHHGREGRVDVGREHDMVQGDVARGLDGKVVAGVRAEQHCQRRVFKLTHDRADHLGSILNGPHHGGLAGNLVQGAQASLRQDVLGRVVKLHPPTHRNDRSTGHARREKIKHKQPYHHLNRLDHSLGVAHGQVRHGQVRLLRLGRAVAVVVKAHVGQKGRVAFPQNLVHHPGKADPRTVKGDLACSPLGQCSTPPTHHSTRPPSYQEARRWGAARPGPP